MLRSNAVFLLTITDKGSNKNNFTFMFVLSSVIVVDN